MVLANLNYGFCCVTADPEWQFERGPGCSCDFSHRAGQDALAGESMKRKQNEIQRMEKDELCWWY